MSHGFHAKNGLHFQRDEDGSVVVRKVDHGLATFKVTLDPDTWASVMASVCVRGEGVATFEEASQFHRQEKE